MKLDNRRREQVVGKGRKEACAVWLGDSVGLGLVGGGDGGPVAKACLEFQQCCEACACQGGNEALGGSWGSSGAEGEWICCKFPACREERVKKSLWGVTRKFH